MAFHDIKSLLHRSIVHSGIKSQVDATSVVARCNALLPAVVGDKVAGHVQAIYTRNKTLTLQCTSSLIMQEVRYRERHLINALNKQLGREAVERVRYTT